MTDLKDRPGSFSGKGSRCTVYGLYPFNPEPWIWKCYELTTLFKERHKQDSGRLVTTNVFHPFTLERVFEITHMRAEQWEKHKAQGNTMRSLFLYAMLPLYMCVQRCVILWKLGESEIKSWNSCSSFKHIHALSAVKQLHGTLGGNTYMFAQQQGNTNTSKKDRQRI